MPTEHVVHVHTPSGKARLELMQTGRTFAVTRFEVEGHEGLSLAFEPSAAGCENLDTTSDIAQVFNLSSKVRYGSVILGSNEMRASSFEELSQVLKRAKVRAFNHEEI